MGEAERGLEARAAVLRRPAFFFRQPLRVERTKRMLKFVKRNRWKVLIGAFIGSALASIVAIDQYGLADRSQPADVIVVLGARVGRSGEARGALARRARWAVELYNKEIAPVIICSGGLGPFPPTEAEAACGLVQALGVPADAILLETQAHSTEETSLYVAEIMRGRGWSSAVAVSDGYHLARTVMLFERVGITAYPSPAQMLSGPMNPTERFFREGRELIAILWYWFKTALGLEITDVQ